MSYMTDKHSTCEVDCPLCHPLKPGEIRWEPDPAPCTAQDRAVIEAAEALDRKFGTMSWQLTDPTGRDAMSRADSIANLRRAVDALIASRRSKGVKPEEVALSERSGLVRAIPEEEYQRLLRIIDRLTELLLAVQQKDK
jgi:hypothetical protein